MEPSDFEVHIFPLRDGARIEAKTAEQRWGKNYPSISAASSEAADLRILTLREKALLDCSQAQTDYPHGWRNTASLELRELERRGFRIDPRSLG